LFPLTSELVSYTGIVTGTMTDTTGQRSENTTIESGMIIKRPDGWKLLCGQSAALPGK